MLVRLCSKYATQQLVAIGQSFDKPYPRQVPTRLITIRCSAGRSVIICSAIRWSNNRRARRCQDHPLGQRIKAPRNKPKARKPGDCQQDNRGIKFQLTHPGAPLRRKPSIYWSGEKRDGFCLNESGDRRGDE
ncbi:conserved hypothetical protein [Trichinella spiralis]|uniref:hypothetical protein n=1 Tax=Trichinella spiralis TaxID=6334 RepID=UPI0001EFD272|nr:conserved hypothetical protein [Trichinella spiralis]